MLYPIHIAMASTRTATSQSGATTASVHDKPGMPGKNKSHAKGPAGLMFSWIQPPTSQSV